MTSETTTIIPSAEGLAHVLLAEDDLALELVGDLERDDRASLADEGRRRGVGGEGIREQEQQRPKEARRQDRAADVAPEGPGPTAQAGRRVVPLLAEAVERGQEDDEHQRDLEIGVDDDEARQGEQPGRIVGTGDLEDVLEEEGHQAGAGERRQEGEGEHDPAELGEHARCRDDHLAQLAVRVTPGDGPGKEPTEDGADDRRADGQLDRLDEGVDEHWSVKSWPMLSRVGSPSDR